MTTTGSTVHATCVALDGRGVLITGPSGSGKSGLALQLMALGGRLVSDDRTVLVVRGGVVCASAPATIAGMIEARGIGIIHVPWVETAAIWLAVDMAMPETARMPQRHTMTLLDIAVPCLHKVDAPHFPAAIIAYTAALRIENE